MRANYEIGASMTLADVAWAHAEQTRIFRRFQDNFRDYDLVLSPTTPVSPFPWTQLYLAEIDGKQARATTTTGWRSPTSSRSSPIPSISLPCGVDHKGMPFGLQVIGRFRGDGEVLDAAQAMEQAFAGHPRAATAAAGYLQARRRAPSRAQIHRHPPAGPDVTVSTNVGS